MALRRIRTELSEMQRSPPENCSAGPINESDQFHWQATILGPLETPYEGGIFRLDVTFPPTYPFDSPAIYFLTKVYHPNIGEDGTLCLDLLYQKWSPALSLSSILLGIGSLLADPYTGHSLQPALAKQWDTDRPAFNKNARLWTRLYATGE